MADRVVFLGKRDMLEQELRRAILRGEFPVGARLRQEDIAQRFGVSATPVREALRVLEAQGMIYHSPNRGVRVADFAGSFEHVYRLREALEGLATEMAIENMDDERAARLLEALKHLETATARGDADQRHAAHTDFHMILYEGCRFPLLLEMIQQLWARFPWSDLITTSQVNLASGHRSIGELAAAKDAAGAAEALRQHLRDVRKSLELRRGRETGGGDGVSGR